MTKIIQKNLKLIIAGIVLLIVLIPIMFWTHQANLKEMEKVTWVYWEKGDYRTGELVITNSIKENRHKQYTVTSYYKLISTVILQIYSDEIRFETFYLERTGVNSFRVKESIVSTSAAYTFDEAVEIAKKYDVYKNNPAPDKIFNHPEFNELGEKQRQLEAEREKQKQNTRWYGYNEGELTKVYKELPTEVQTQAFSYVSKLLSEDENVSQHIMENPGYGNQQLAKYLIENGYIPDRSK